MSCGFIDLDGFKGVNDRRGHPHGSRVLARVAKALRQGVRSGDSVGRYGGDEFILLMPDTGLAAALTVAGRMREMIATATLDDHDPLDASVGVAEWQPGWTADQLLEAANSALLEAKRAGGGLVLQAVDTT